MGVSYTKTLRQEYIDLYKSIEIKTTKLAIIENHVDQILANKQKYESVTEELSIPWFFVGLIHTLESNRDFNTHLHNGDPLTKRTRQVPKGRPKSGSPPFTWEESALDALKYKKFHRETDWSLTKILYNLEKYNGWGYRLHHPHVKSPYLWSYSNHYRSGKYIADGTFSEDAVSRQSGAAVIMRRMEQRAVIDPFKIITPSFFSFSNSEEVRVKDLQRFLNSFDGIALLVDGIPGKNTSAACKKIFGHYLEGDERINA
ncbi:MAG: hypothetical protein AAF806_10100 [Bacteroidota bacterium]